MRITLYQWCIENKREQLLKEWDHSKNGDVTPQTVTSGSGFRAWWKCSICEREWSAFVYHRVYGADCTCQQNIKIGNSNRAKHVAKSGSLTQNNPKLASEWNYDKNYVLNPDEVTSGSGQLVWWKCKNGHEWEATVNSRNRGNGCPYCSGRIATKETSLKIVNPMLSSEWHPIKNGDLTPYDILPNSTKSTCWLCNSGHEWKAKVAYRNNGVGCPICQAESKTSFPEQAILFYLKQYFTTESRATIEDCEIDIFLNEYNIGIEYDGMFYHSFDSSQNREKRKNSKLRKAGIRLIRIKEVNVPQENDFANLMMYCVVDRDQKYISNIVKVLITWICKICNLDNNFQLDIDIADDRQAIFEQYIQSKKENSLTFHNPEAAKLWDYEKNYPLTPENISFASNKLFWWKCSLGHSWEASVNSINRRPNCPYCSRQRVSELNSLQAKNTTLAGEWHYEKNGMITPSDISIKSHNKVWWKCPNGHVYKASVAARSIGNDCPYCSHHRVTKETSLQAVNPTLAAEWHPTKNQKLIPSNVLPYSGKKVWWKCSMGHEWQATVSNRSCGRNCAYCSGKILTKERSLGTLNPQLAREWHPTKNGDITSYDVSLHSGKKVWWICSKGHEWEAVINSRSKSSKSSCPVCARERQKNK